MDDGSTTIRISKEAKYILEKFGKFGDSWNDCIIKMNVDYCDLSKQLKISKEDLKKQKNNKQCDKGMVRSKGHSTAPTKEYKEFEDQV